MSETTVAGLVAEYLRLGGTRKSANDDNVTSTRKWDSEPAEAKAYWEANIATLDGQKRQEAETLLPSVSSHD